MTEKEFVVACKLFYEVRRRGSVTLDEAEKLTKNGMRLSRAWSALRDYGIVDEATDRVEIETTDKTTCRMLFCLWISECGKSSLKWLLAAVLIPVIGLLF